MKRTAIRVPYELWEKLKNIAKYRGQTINGLAIEIFWKFVEDWENKSVNKNNNNYFKTTKVVR